VLALLSLFAILGLSFVLYAGAAAEASRLHREAQSPARPDVDPELLFAYFLGQLVYDVPDDSSGVYSALRGHSLARNLYGCNDDTGSANLVPFNGTGRLRAPTPFGPDVNDAQLINYTYYPNDPQLPAARRFLRDPERLGWRAASLSAPRGAFTGGFNAPYTYPDLNTLFLAAVRGDGAVLLPSFCRPWAARVAGLLPEAGEFFDRASGRLNPFWAPDANPPPWFKYTTLRPLPALNPGFPAPEDGGGDVKNLVGGPGTLRRINPATGQPEYWGNDSFWMDLGFPVLTAPDGRKYKPLFAALITDLDNRLNVNVHGNIAGDNFRHRSNQGWGPWEVNLGKVLSPADPTEEWTRLLRGGSPSTRSLWDGRYGADRHPTSRHPGNVAPLTFQPRFYSQVDLDGRDESAGGAASGRWRLPEPPASAGDVRRWYPSFGGGYGNSSAAERTHHPLLFDFFSPQVAGGANFDRSFALSNLEALLRHGDTGSAALTSDLARLCPTSFSNARGRHLVTTHSFDLDRPGVSPWVYNPAGAAYEAAATDDPDRPALPEGPPIPFPSLALRTSPSKPVHNGDFDAPDWRSRSAARGRVDLNRPLPPYPHQGSGRMPPFGPPLTVAGGQVALDLPFSVDAPDGPIWKQFLLAQEARQRLANDLYRRLLAVTGVTPILPDQHPQEPPLDLLRSRRWLAQLAANIVDYLDEDDLHTPFCFYTAEDYQDLPSPPRLPPDPGRVDPGRPASGPDGELQWPVYWVFGTELPRVVVSEALAVSGRNNPNEAYEDTVRVFVELHNPFPRAVPPGTHQPDRFPVPLRMGVGATAYSPYRVLIGVKSPVPGRAAGAAVLPGVENDNVLGNPDLAVLRRATTDADLVEPLRLIGPGRQPDWPGASGPPAYRSLASPYVPAHGPDTNDLPQGFMLLGPPEDGPELLAAFDPFRDEAGMGIPRQTPLLRAAGLQYSRAFRIRQPNDPPDERTEGVTVLLRRLANPHLPFDGRRSLGAVPNPTYNPYITVDYLEDMPVHAVGSEAALPVVSRGKPQPFAAHRNLVQPQQPRAGAEFRHSLGKENVPAPPHYDWLTHLDRPLISPMELLHVSGYQPYQLTQRFLVPDESGQLVKFGHRAPWLDEGRLPGRPSHRLYRLFEFVTAGPRSAGVAAGGRLPGKINLNTVWDEEVFQALCDAQPSNAFQEADVRAAFRQFCYDPRRDVPSNPLRRTQGLFPGGTDRPFRGLAVGTYPPGDGLVPSGGGTVDTVLRLQPPAGGTHPYLASELLTKIFNQVTTRSNVFAVWLTVGFFEVTDDTVRPVKLGAELGRAENRHVRHRMFAILDRTNLSIASCVTFLSESIAPPLDASAPLWPQTVPVGALSGTTPVPVAGSGLSWEIEPGATLVVDTGTNQEAVEVLAVDPAANPPTITAVFTQPHTAGAAISLPNTPGAPPVFLKPLGVEGPDPLASPPYSLTVTVAVDPSRSSSTALVGDYDGITWTIRPGARLLLDVGLDQEAVVVQAGPFALDTALATGAFRVAVARPHADGFVISNTLLGNPGPQRRFNPRDPAFAAVVRYLSILQ
jgi:hypothetical protein